MSENEVREEKRPTNMGQRQKFSRGLVVAVVMALVFLMACEEREPEGDPTKNETSKVFREFDERKLRIPKSRESESCELEHYAIHIRGVPAEAALGKGPVRLVFPAIPRVLDLFPPEEDASFAGSKWRGAEVSFVSEPRYDGPVLVRGGQIDGEHRIGFGDDETPLWELRLPAGDWEPIDGLRVWGDDQRLQPAAAGTDGTEGCPRCLQLSNDWRVQRATLRIAADGCYGMQLDGQGFSQVIEFGAIWHPGSG